MLQPAVTRRRADLDWLRVSAFALLILYHAGMPWSGWSWHLTSADSLDWLREGMRFVNRWRMPLIFVVSGAAIMLALGQRTAGAFALDRVRRLLLPLAVGMLVLVPPQVYLERLRDGSFTGSFGQWLPEAFRGVYPAGNLSWHHLWFLAYVLVLTFVLLPGLLWLRSERGRAAHARADRLMARSGVHWLMPLPLAAASLWLAPISYNSHGLIGDWHGMASSGLLLFYGAFLYGCPQLLGLLNRQCFVSLGIAAVAYAVFYLAFVDGAVRPLIPPERQAAYALLSSFNTMAWLFALIGLANRYLTRPSVLLGRATEAVYPFYMLHQTVTVVAVYFLLELGVAPVAGFVLAAVATFSGTSVLYFCLVRPLSWMRPLFGLPARHGIDVRGFKTRASACRTASQA